MSRTGASRVPPPARLLTVSDGRSASSGTVVGRPMAVTEDSPARLWEIAVFFLRRRQEPSLYFSVRHRKAHRGIRAKLMPLTRQRGSRLSSSRTLGDSA